MAATRHCRTWPAGWIKSPPALDDTMATTETLAASASPDLIRRGAVATGLALVVNAFVVFATTSTGAVEPFQPLGYPRVLFLTALGTVGATAVYSLIRQRRARPERDFAVVVVVVLLASFVPDLTFVPTLPGATTPAITVLMAMHVTTAAISYAVLTR